MKISTWDGLLTRRDNQDMVESLEGLEDALANHHNAVARESFSRGVENGFNSGLAFTRLFQGGFVPPAFGPACAYWDTTTLFYKIMREHGEIAFEKMRYEAAEYLDFIEEQRNDD